MLINILWGRTPFILILSFAYGIAYANTPPTKPENLAAIADSDSAVTLSWDASTDDRRVKHYRISVNQIPVAETRRLGYTVTGLDADTYYQLDVDASDGRAYSYLASIAVATLEKDPELPTDPIVENSNVDAEIEESVIDGAEQVIIDAAIPSSIVTATISEVTGEPVITSHASGDTLSGPHTTLVWTLPTSDPNYQIDVHGLTNNGVKVIDSDALGHATSFTIDGTVNGKWPNTFPEDGGYTDINIFYTTDAWANGVAGSVVFRLNHNTLAGPTLAEPTVTKPTVSEPTVTVPANELLEDAFLMSDDAYLAKEGGGLFLMDGLVDHNVGNVGSDFRYTSQRFRATASGTVASIRNYWIASASGGYSEGTGGTIVISVHPNQLVDGVNIPNETVTIASATYVPALLNGAYSDSTPYDKVIFDVPGDLIKGELYHLTYKNIDPGQNHIGIDNFLTVDGNKNINNWIDPLEFGVVQFRDGRWIDRSQPTGSNSMIFPNFELELTNGKYMGMLQTQTGNHPDANRDKVMTAGDMIRTVFTPNTTKNLHFWSFIGAFETAGDFTVRLKQGSTVLETWGFSDTAKYNKQSVGATGRMAGLWQRYDHQLTTPLTLNSATEYTVEYEINSGTFRTAYARDWRHKKELTLNVIPKNFVAQHFSNGSWRNFYHTSTGNSSTPQGAWNDVAHFAP